MEDLGMLITLGRRHVWNAATRRLEESGYSMLSWALLGYLTKMGPATQRDIAQGIGQHPAGVSRLIDEMEALGFVRRRRDETDRRRARVEVARAGRTMFKAAHPLVIAALKEALRGLSMTEQRELGRLLRKLISVDMALVEIQRDLQIPRVASAKRATVARSKTARPRPEK